MTPKEKAKELVDKFYGEHPTQPPRMKGSTSIICALIAVEEIIESINNLQYERKTDFWENVKTEIEKL